MSAVLLDTQAFLLWIEDSPQLPRKAYGAIEAALTTVFFSPISAWEIAIKVGVGKMTIGDAGTGGLADAIGSAVVTNGFTVLPVDLPHALAVDTLPLHHRDPFDRLLIAQAMVEDLPVITGDRAFAAYDVDIIW